MKLTLLLISLGIFISYISFIWIRYGVQPSISQTFYVIDKRLKILFTLFIWAFIFPIIIAVETPLMFFCGSFIAFVGASPNFDDRLEGDVHNTAAIGGIILGVLSLIFDHDLLILPISLLGIISLFLYYKIKNRIWWVEIITFLTIVLTNIYLVV